jgi:hypothetical protein
MKKEASMNKKYKIVRVDGSWKMVFTKTFEKRLAQLPLFNRWGVRINAWWARITLMRAMKKWRQAQLVMNRRNLKRINREQYGRQGVMGLVFRMLKIKSARRAA